MTIRNILVPICSNIPFDRQLDAALDLARRLEAHINAIYIRPDPRLVYAGEPILAITAGATLSALDRLGQEHANAAHAKFDEWRSQHELDSAMVDLSLRTPFARWSERTAMIEPTIVRCARLSDVVVLNRPDPMVVATQAAVDAAVFESGRPVLLVPKKTSGDLLRHVMIAWNGSLEATRAVAGAMTMLHEADQVSVFVTAEDEAELPEDLDLATFLTWHGIRAAYYRARLGEADVGKRLLRAADEHGVSMLVMGAYTHSRLRQALLGGVTKCVLEQAELPVLMMH